MKKQNEPASADHAEKLYVDLDGLVNKLGGNNKQVLRCLDIFKTDAPASMHVIKTGLKNQEVKEAKNSCHGLRGMLLTMEMKKAASTAMLLETLIIEKKFEIAIQLIPLFENEIGASVDLIETSLTARK